MYGLGGGAGAAAVGCAVNGSPNGLAAAGCAGALKKSGSGAAAAGAAAKGDGELKSNVGWNGSNHSDGQRHSEKRNVVTTKARNKH